MDYLLKTREIADGVFFNSISDGADRFKTDRISVNFILKLSEATAAENAILPFILEKSSEDYPDFTKLNRELDRLYGAGFAGSVKKIGDLQVLTLAISSIDDQFALDGEQMTRVLAEILAGAALRPYLPDGSFEDKRFELEKQNLIDLIDGEINEKREYAISRTEQLMGRGTPYGVKRLGTSEQAGALNKETALEAYKKAVESARIEIMFTGCGDSDAAFNVFSREFSKVNRRYSEKITSGAAPICENVTEQTDYFDVAQSKLVLGFKTGQSAEDINALRVMTALYGGTPVSKLFVNVRERLSLCYYCAARYDRLKGIVMVDSGVETSNIDKAKKEILNQLEEIIKGNITDEELAFTKLSLKNSFKTVGDSAYGLESWYLGQRITGTENNPADDAEKLDEITKEDIIKAAKLLRLDAVYILTGSDKGEN